MKLIYVIVRNIDSGDVTAELNKHGYYVTKLASTGVFTGRQYNFNDRNR